MPELHCISTSVRSFLAHNGGTDLNAAVEWVNARRGGRHQIRLDARVPGIGEDFPPKCPVCGASLVEKCRVLGPDDGPPLYPGTIARAQIHPARAELWTEMAGAAHWLSRRETALARPHRARLETALAQSGNHGSKDQVTSVPRATMEAQPQPAIRTPSRERSQRASHPDQGDQ